MKQKVLTGVLWAGLFGAFWISGYKSLDPDFGWHLQMGRYILEKGIPATDPFSYTMASYPFVDHEWLTNTLMAKLYPVIGMAGLAAIFAGLAIAAVMIIIPRTEWHLGLVPILMGAGVFITRFGVRPQVEDWLLLAITYRLATGANWDKWKITVPLLFCLWANLHGGFMLGPVALGVILGLKFWEHRQIVVSDVMIWVLGLTATLINPYGIRLWWEVAMQITDTDLRNNIAEWQPFYARAELGFWMVAALAAALIKVCGKELEKWEWGILLGLFFAALSSLRNAPLFMLMVIWITVKMLRAEYEIIKKDKVMLFRAKRFYLILVTVAVVIFIEEVGITVIKTVTGKWVWYPVEATEHLKTQNYKGNLFSSYGWGGYLIWKLPERRLFIDGRMPSWRWTVTPAWLNGLIGAGEAPATESDWAFKDYIKVADEGNFEEYFKKYNVGVVLWPTGAQEVEQKPLIDLSETWWWKKLFGEKPKGRFIEKLKEGGWKRVYEDGVAEIYVKN